VVSARDVISPTAKSVADVALLLDVLTESTESMTYTKELSNPSLKGKKLAVVTELYKYTYNSPNEFKQTDSEVVALFEKAIEDIKAQGGEVVEVSIPKLFTYFNTCRESMSGSAAAKQALLSELKNLLSQNGADAFVFPSYLSTPFKSGFNESGLHNSTNELYMNCGAYLPSLVGLPAISVPMGYLESGVAAGIEFVALPSNDGALLSVANAYEKATEHRKPSEKTPNLYDPIELKVEEEEEKEEAEKEETSSKEEIKPTDKEKDKFKGEMIAVGVIIGAVLILSIWVLVFGSKGKKRGVHKNRHF
jgi:Asp-tRNA(Asn)/Glu-tRNA(Gln) amidotransferase A subunit family amidase